MAVTPLPRRNASGIPTTQSSMQLTDYQGTPMNGPSGKAPVINALAAVSAGDPFLPVAGRDFNIVIGGTFSAVVLLERSFDYDPDNPGAATWYTVVTDATRQLLPESFIWNEPEFYVIYRIRCTGYTSGTINARISQ